MGEKKGRGFYRKMGRGAQSKVLSKTRKDSTFVYILIEGIAISLSKNFFGFALQ